MAASKQQIAGRQRAIRHAAGAGDPRRARVSAVRQSPLPSPLSPLRSAFTLIEMLVVISILVMLAAITVPNIRPALESRRMREAARSVEAYLNRARVDAIERGLPVGVEFVRANGQNEACVQLRQVVVQPVFTGLDDTSVVGVQLQAAGGTTITITPVSSSITSADVATGDQIQFGSRAWNPAAPTYTLTVTVAAGVTTFTATLNNAGVVMPWPTATLAPTLYSYQPFAVYRRPTVSSPLVGAVAPLQLPESLCIDLYESGTDNVSFPTAATSVMVMFGPNGTVQEIINGAGISPVDRLYFLMGRRDRLPARAWSPRDPTEAEDGLRNWEDLNNLWVSIVPRTGMTVTTENAAYSKPTSFDYSNSTQRHTALQAARGIAQTAQTMGGR